MCVQFIFCVYGVLALSNFAWFLSFVPIFFSRLCFHKSPMFQKQFYKIGVLKNFAKFVRKHLCRSCLLIKLQAGSLKIYLKRDSGTYVLLRISPSFRNTHFVEQLRTEAGVLKYFKNISSTIINSYASG